MGNSTRHIIKGTSASIGTRLKNKIDRKTATEANRFFFEGYKTNRNTELISDIRAKLEQLPDNQII